MSYEMKKTNSRFDLYAPEHLTKLISILEFRITKNEYIDIEVKSL